MKEHHFEIEDAKKYGINKAVILYNIRFWLEKNKANNKNKYKTKDSETYYWIYNSATAFEKLFPYFNERSISRWLKELCEEGALLKDSFNKKKYDKTNWYSMPEFIISRQNGYNISKNDVKTSQNDVSSRQNGDDISQNGVRTSQNGVRTSQDDGPIPDSNTYSNTDSNLQAPPVCSKKKEPKKTTNKEIEILSSEEMIKKTMDKNIKELMTVFYENDKCFSGGGFFGRKVFRDDARFLIEQYGLEEILVRAKKAVSLLGVNFAPQITNPSELRYKMIKMESFLIREQNKPGGIVMGTDFSNSY